MRSGTPRSKVRRENMAKGYAWQFKSSIRANAFGWHGGRLASTRLKEAVSEIKKVGKSDSIAAADGAVTLIERLWPALQGVDDSSGALGSAVRRSLDALIPLVVSSSADSNTRREWMERLYEAVCEDGVDCLAPVEEKWGALCASSDLAGEWADRLLPLVRRTWSSSEPGGWATGATLCLSCLLETSRFEELHALLALQTHKFWHFEMFGVMALARQGRINEAIAYAEACRGERYDDGGISRFCEELLLKAGRRDEAYSQYGLVAAGGPTRLAVFNDLVRKYPERDHLRVLLDLVEREGNEGKWFAAAKHAGFMELALGYAASSSADPATLIRASRDHAKSEPMWAARIALHAIESLLRGGGYDPIPLDILNAHQFLMEAAANIGQTDWAQKEVEATVSRGAVGGREDMLKTLVNAVRRARVQ